MSRSRIGIIVPVAVLLLVSVAVVATAEAPATLCITGTLSEGGPVRVISQDFDLQGCQEECRRRFGYELYWHGGRGAVSPGYWLYARCIANCNRAHWDAFDREMDELEKE